MKNIISRFGIQLAAASCLLAGASSAYAGNVNLDISLGWPFYTPTHVVYVSPTHASPHVVHASPAMIHKPYRGYRPHGPIDGKAHAAPQRHNIASQKHNVVSQRHIQGAPAQARHTAPQYQHQQRSYR